MKKIRIENYSNPVPGSVYIKDKSYWVWLGNGVKRSFSNRKHAEAFLVKTSRFLTEKVFEVNRLYIEIFAEYRKLWFYFDADDRATGEKVDNIIEWTNKKFNVMIDVAGGINGNHFTFTNLRVIIDNLREITGILEQLQKRKNNWVEKYNLAVITARLNELENALAKYENEAQ